MKYVAIAIAIAITACASSTPESSSTAAETAAIVAYQSLQIFCAAHRDDVDLTEDLRRACEYEERVRAVICAGEGGATGTP